MRVYLREGNNNMKKNQKHAYPDNLRGKLGFSLPGISMAFSAVIYGLFMQYLTDYSGIDEAIGAAGWAAAFGTVFLVVSRIIDALDDPIQGFVMDNAKERPFGKYRFFTIIGLVLIAIGIIGMFSIPNPVKGNKVTLTIWVFVSYLIYEMGTAFNGIIPLIQKTTSDAKVRTKIMTWHRMFLIIGAVPATFFVPIATAVNVKIGDMGKSYSITSFIVIVIATLISLLGTALIVEPYRPDEASKKEEHRGRIDRKDIGLMLKTNKPMWVHNIGYVVGNSCYAFTSSMFVYFAKWYYCADASGVVDNVYYAKIYSLNSILSIVGAFGAPLLASYVTKKIGSVDKAARSCMLISGIGYLGLYVLYLTGALGGNPYLYVVLNFVIGLPVSMATIPFLLLNVEVADYAEYRTGKNMTAITNSVNNILQKFDSAMASAITGVLLIVVGYSVNAKTGAFAGDVAMIPSMVGKMALFVSLIPALFCIASWLIYRFLYPITPELRAKMTSELDKRHEKEQEEGQKA